MRLKVEMQVGKAVQYSILDLPYPANVSNKPSRVADGFKGFQLSADKQWPVSVLNNSYRLFNPEEGYLGYLSKIQWREAYQEFAIYTSEGYVEIEPEFTITFHEKVSYIFLTFDRITGEYATEIVIKNGDTGLQDSVYPVGATYAHYFEEPTSSVTIRFKRWSRDNGTIRFTYVGTNPTLTFRGSEVENVECSEQAWNSTFNLSTGFIQQYADITFRDFTGVLQNLSDNGLLSRFMLLSISIDYKDVQYALGTYISDTWSVDKTESRVTVSCNDYTRNFEKYTVDVIAENASVRQLFELLSSQIPEVSIVPKTDSEVTDPLNGEVVSIPAFLDSCISKDVYFQGVTADEVVNQLSDRWMLRLYWQPQLGKYVIMEAW